MISNREVILFLQIVFFSEYKPINNSKAIQAIHFFFLLTVPTRLRLCSLATHIAMESGEAKSVFTSNPHSHEEWRGQNYIHTALGSGEANTV